MKIELLIDDKKGNVFDISDLVEEINWKTKRKDSPGTLDITLLEDTLVTIGNGHVIRLKVNDCNVFYGYIFKNGGDSSPELKVTAYDQMKYLMYNDVYVGVNKKASDIVSEILSSFGLSIGTIEDTGYVIPTIQEDDKKMLDVIQNALSNTTINNTKTFVLYDDFGIMNLKDINNMREYVCISDDSTLGEYEWENSIEDSYNVIKLVKDNKETKGRDVYIAQDSESIANWGRLQYFKKVDSDLNKAQIEEMAQCGLDIYNKEKITFKLKDVVGTETAMDIKLRGGAGIYLEIKKKNMSQWALIESATHKFTKNEHTMDFELKVV